MIGRWVESKAALFDAIAEDPLYLYSDNWASIFWTPKEFDEREYHVDSFYQERAYMKETGVYTLDYAVNSQLDYTNNRDNVIVGAYINGVLDESTLSYSYVRNSATGLSTNSKSVRITITQPNSYIDLRVKRNVDYRGVIYLLEGESTFGLKKERPLNEGGK